MSQSSLGQSSSRYQLHLSRAAVPFVVSCAAAHQQHAGMTPAVAAAGDILTKLLASRYPSRCSTLDLGFRRSSTAFFAVSASCSRTQSPWSRSTIRCMLPAGPLMAPAQPARFVGAGADRRRRRALQARVLVHFLCEHASAPAQHCKPQHWSAARVLPVLIRARGRSSYRASIAPLLLYFGDLVGCLSVILAQSLSST